MSWLFRQLARLCSALWEFMARIVSWVCDSVVWLFNRVANSVGVFISGLLAGLAGVMPSETLSETWQAVLNTITWLDGWPAYLAHHAFALPDLLARMTYFGGLFAAAMLARGAFTAIKAALDLL